MNLFMKTEGINIALSTELIEKTFNKQEAKSLKTALMANKSFYYLKTLSKKDYMKDKIGFYNEKAHKYVTFDIVKVAQCVAVKDVIALEKAVKKQESLIKAGKLSEKFTAEEYANIMTNGKAFAMGLECKPLPVILEFNYWLDFAYKTLKIRAPKSEEELTDRYLKTIKIYALAYHVGHNLPVPLLRTVVKEMSASCPTVHEYRTYDEALEGLVSESNVVEYDTYTKKATMQVEVKCQTTYPVSKYEPSVLVVGYESTSQVEGSIIADIIDSRVAELGTNVAFVTKTTKVIRVYGNDQRDTETSTYKSSLNVYVPVSADKKENCITTTEDLANVAYSMAISLNYPLVRILFR